MEHAARDGEVEPVFFEELVGLLAACDCADRADGHFGAEFFLDAFGEGLEWRGGRVLAVVLRLFRDG